MRPTPRMAGLAVLCMLLASAPASGATWSWRHDALPDDVGRLQALPQAWQRAVDDARATGQTRALIALGDLVNPLLAFDRAEPPPGVYHCRTVRLGSQHPPAPSVVAYPWYLCRIAFTPGGDLLFAKDTGTQRTVGHLYPDSDRRFVYLGAADLADGTQPTYGPRAERNQAGVLERIGPRRWRLSLPFPRQDSLLDLIDIVR